MPSPDPTLDIAPGFDFDGSFVCPVCHEHGEPDDYEAGSVSLVNRYWLTVS